jgi:signal transduction histidine kinase
MGERIRAHDWSASTLGPPQTWPQGLKTAVRLLLSTQHPMFIWWGPELLQFYNDAYRRSMGPERHPSALGQGGRECWAEIWHLIGWQIEQVLAGGQSTWHENQLVPITRFGRREQVYWTYSYSPIDEPTAANTIGGVLVVCTETTERVLMEQRLSAADAGWRAVFEHAPGFMAILNGPDHVFEYANGRYRDLVGGRAILGKPVGLALPEIQSQGFVELLDNVYCSGETHVGVATPVLLEQGNRSEVRYLDFVYQALREPSGAIKGVFVDGFDVTERVLSTQALELADRRKNEFLAILAHELRNPLAPIRNAAEVLTLSGPTDSRSTNMVALIKRQAGQLTRLVDDLLDVARVGQGRVDLQFERLDLGSLVRQGIETALHYVQAKEHHLTVDVPAEPLYVRVDRGRIVQCVSNLLVNAAKYTDREGQIRVALSQVGHYAEVAVSDNGMGIATEFLPQVFDMISQQPESLNHSQGGLGIGLHIVKQMITLHAGEVSAASEGVGRGASFYLRLPLAPG